tara:strand:+ start:2959 stop:4044 length:1086 start_codon:yes stop_codon:yes gene_type:complete
LGFALFELKQIYFTFKIFRTMGLLTFASESIISKDFANALRILGHGLPVYKNQPRAIEMRYMKPGADEVKLDYYNERHEDPSTKIIQDIFNTYSLDETSNLRTLLAIEKAKNATQTGIIDNAGMCLGMLGMPLNLLKVIPKELCQVTETVNIAKEEAKDGEIITQEVTFDLNAKEIMLNLLRQGLLPEYANQIEGAFSMVWYYKENPSALLSYTHEANRKGKAKFPLYMFENENGAIMTSTNRAIDSAQVFLSTAVNGPKFERLPGREVWVLGNHTTEDPNMRDFLPHPKQIAFFAKMKKEQEQKELLVAAAKVQRDANTLRKEEERKAIKEKLVADKIKKDLDMAQTRKMFKLKNLKAVL